VQIWAAMLTSPLPSRCVKTPSHFLAHRTQNWNAAGQAGIRTAEIGKLEMYSVVHSDSVCEGLCVQLLVANKDAGTVIGRSGGTIQKIQSETGCRVRVSNNGDFYPGTNDRVVLVTGSTEAVSQGVGLVLSELYENAEEIQKNGGVPVDIVVLSVLVPEKASGLIIGRGGESIREMVEQSGAKIQLTSKEKQISGLDERVLTCTGTIPQIKKAVALVVYKICEDPSAAYTNMTTQYSRYLAPAGPPRGMGGMGFGSSAMSGYGASGGMAGMAPMGGMGMDQAYAQQMVAYGGADPYGGYGAAATYGMDPSQFGGPPSYGAPAPSAAPGGGTTYTIYVPDMAVSAILGRGGVVIKEMMEQSGKFWKPVKPTPCTQDKRCIASLCRFALLFIWPLRCRRCCVGPVPVQGS